MPGLGTVLFFARMFLGWLLRAVLTFISAPSNLVIAAVLVAVTFSWGHHKGRVKERHIWEAKIESERRSQAIITAAADAAATKELQELNDERDILNSQIETLRAEAEGDANAARICLGADSLRRINQGRQGEP
jgi:hypothetical protein